MVNETVNETVNPTNKTPRPPFSKWWEWVIVAVIIGTAVIVGTLINNSNSPTADDNSKTPTTEVTETPAAEVTETPTAEVTETPEMRVENDVKKTVDNIKTTLEDSPSATSISGDSSISSEGTVNKLPFEIVTRDDATIIKVEGRHTGYTVRGTNSSVYSGEKSYFYNSRTDTGEWVETATLP